MIYIKITLNTALIFQSGILLSITSLAKNGKTTDIIDDIVIIKMTIMILFL